MGALYPFFRLMNAESRLQSNKEGILLPGSKTQINQQLILDEINIFISNISRDIRNAKFIDISPLNNKLTIKPVDFDINLNPTTYEYFKENYTEGKITYIKVVKKTINNGNIIEKTLINNIKDLIFSDQSNGKKKIIKIDIKYDLNDSDKTFSTTLLRRNSET